MFAYSCEPRLRGRHSSSLFMPRFCDWSEQIKFDDFWFFARKHACSNASRFDCTGICYLSTKRTLSDNSKDKTGNASTIVFSPTRLVLPKHNDPRLALFSDRIRKYRDRKTKQDATNQNDENTIINQTIYRSKLNIITIPSTFYVKPIQSKIKHCCHFYINIRFSGFPIKSIWSYLSRW